MTTAAITVNRKPLLSALAACQCVVAKASTIPILTCVKIRVADSVTVAGTDLETWIEQPIPALSITGTFTMILPLDLLMKFLESSKADAVTFDVQSNPEPLRCGKCNDGQVVTEKGRRGQDSRVNLTDETIIEPCNECSGTGEGEGFNPGNVKITAGASMEMDSFHSDSYPELPDIGGPDWPVTSLLKITADAWLDMANKTSYAISLEESRFTLNGFLLEISDKVRMVATDGCRLTIVERGEMPEDNPVQRALIPARVAGYVKKVLGKSTSVMTICRTNKPATKTDVNPANYGVIVADNVTMVFRLLSGNLPDFQRVLPSYTTDPCTVSASDLLTAIDGVKLAADERSLCIRLEFDHDSVTLRAESADRGKASMAVPCQAGDCHGVKLGLNWSYLADFLKSLDKSDTITIRCAGPGPVTSPDTDNPLTPEELAEKAEAARLQIAASSALDLRSVLDHGCRSVLMPMRI
jgi:DNA polymerase III sliding clamp (beta) subunit (PCNA family)